MQIAVVIGAEVATVGIETGGCIEYGLPVHWSIVGATSTKMNDVGTAEIFPSLCSITRQGYYSFGNDSTASDVTKLDCSLATND